MEISRKCFEKIKELEGCRLTAYKCPAGVLTIGYGHTRGVRPKMTITQAQADSLLRGDLLPCERYVNGLKLRLTQGQYDALVDFVYNLGANKLQGSTLLNKVRTHAPVCEVQAEFKRWVYAGGKHLQGLVARRDWEARRYAERE